MPRPALPPARRLATRHGPARPPDDGPRIAAVIVEKSWSPTEPPAPEMPPAPPDSKDGLDWLDITLIILTGGLLLVLMLLLGPGRPMRDNH